MIYSEQEKRRMEHILEAFHDYIKEHTFFDIVYSDKIGYFRVQVEYPDEEGLVVIRSVDKLLDVLFNEIINDILYAEDGGRHDNTELLQEEAAEARRRITTILEALDDGADYCLDFLDTYLENYPTTV